MQAAPATVAGFALAVRASRIHAGDPDLPAAAVAAAAAVLAATPGMDVVGMSAAVEAAAAGPKAAVAGVQGWRCERKTPRASMACRVGDVWESVSRQAPPERISWISYDSARHAVQENRMTANYEGAGQ